MSSVSPGRGRQRTPLVLIIHSVGLFYRLRVRKCNLSQDYLLCLFCCRKSHCIIAGPQNLLSMGTGTAEPRDMSYIFGMNRYAAVVGRVNCLGTGVY